MDNKDSGIIFSQEQLSDGDLSSSPSRPASPTAEPSGLVKSHTAVLNPERGSGSPSPTSSRPGAPFPSRSTAPSPPRSTGDATPPTSPARDQADISRPDCLAPDLADYSRPTSPAPGNYEEGYVNITTCSSTKHGYSDSIPLVSEASGSVPHYAMKLNAYWLRSILALPHLSLLLLRSASYVPVKSWPAPSLRAPQQQVS